MLLKKERSLTTLYVSNHIINARYNYSLIQERIFNYVLFHCKEYIDKVKNGTPVHQLDLFNDVSNETIKIKISLKHISPPDEYDHVRESMQKMCGIVVETEVKDNKERKWKQWQGLFTQVNIPAESKRSAFMIATMNESVAKMLVSIQHRADGVPINFTTFKYEVAMNTKNKYTARIYKLLCSWKRAGGFYYSVDALRELLQLGNKYKDAEALRRCILIPVWKELKENADVWFNLTEASFEEKEGKKVIGFNFKVISDLHNVNYSTQLDYLIHTLRTEYKLTIEHIDKIRYIIEDTNNWSELHYRMSKVDEKLRTDRGIRDRAAYTFTAIINHFKEG